MLVTFSACILVGCEELEKALNEAGTEVARLLETPTPGTGAAFKPEEHVNEVREVEGQKPILGFFASPIGGGSGTGWYIASDRLVTAAHVVANNEPILLERFGGWDLFRVDVIAVDGGKDIAMLKPEENASAESSPPVLSLSGSTPTTGQKAWGICASPAEEARTIPMTVEQTGVNGEYGKVDKYPITEGIRLKGEAHGGCSGGPVLDDQGNVIGMMVAAGEGQTLATSVDTIGPWIQARLND
jgi:S1-C subfamily serine protease